MTIVSINGRFLTKRITGVQRYAREIVHALAGLPSLGNSSLDEIRLIIPKSACIDKSVDRLVIITTPKSNGFIWGQFILPFFVKGTLLNLENIGAIAVRRQITCVHDINTFLVAKSYSNIFRLYYRVMIPVSILRAKHIVSVSAFSARMIVEAGLCKPNKITVIPNGHEHIKRWDADRSSILLSKTIQRPYIFILGSKARHKNIKIIEEIASEIDNLGFDILVAGPTDGPFSSVEVGGILKNVRLLGFVTDDDLAALYQSAFCFVFPSLTEGFGLPALEAMALGCPVIASRAASIPEVCGDAALYADPNSSDEWLREIKRLRSDAALRSMLVAAGRQQALKFSWSKSAEMYRSLLIKLADPEFF